MLYDVIHEVLGLTKPYFLSAHGALSCFWFEIGVDAKQADYLVALATNKGFWGHLKTNRTSHQLLEDVGFIRDAVLYYIWLWFPVHILLYYTQDTIVQEDICCLLYTGHANFPRKPRNCPGYADCRIFILSMDYILAPCDNNNETNIPQIGLCVAHLIGHPETSGQVYLCAKLE